jgi:hypothetical protein
MGQPFFVGAPFVILSWGEAEVACPEPVEGKDPGREKEGAQ